MKTRIIVFMCILGIISAQAQTDSTAVSSGNKQETATLSRVPISTKQFNLNNTHHTFCTSLPLAAVGLAMIPIDMHVRDGVAANIPNFSSPVDDYIQYVPWVAHAGLGLLGVKGCSKSRYQIFTADVMAALMMATVVNGLKYTINRTRPNGDNASFPSGHTATAFTGATLLAHEYGHKSVWIPIAGYTLATATGVMRVLNNRHYVSDVIVGAAVGILTAELAYWATDALFKDRKLYKSRHGRVHYDVIKNY